MFETREVDYRSTIVEVAGKLRGSKARQLADRVDELHGRGYDRLVIDLRGSGSIDSLGARALDRAVDLVQEVHLVVTWGFPLTQYYPIVGSREDRVRVHHDVDEAVRLLKAGEESGVFA